MAVRIKCPACAEVMVVGSEAAGDTFPCRVCGQRLRVPAAKPAPPPEPEITLADDLPDEPRPRRRDSDAPRRRARPARRRGRGVGFTLLLGCGGLCLVAVLGCGGLFFAFGTPHWREHESDRGAFRVELPAAPRDDLAQLAKAQLTPGTTVEGTLLLLYREDYAVIYADLPPDRVALGTDVLLDDGIAGIARGPNPGRVVKQQPVTVSGFPGREAVVEVEGKGSVVARIVIADGRAYVVIAGGPSDAANNPRVRRFIDSFEITDRDRMPGAVARRQAAERAEAARRQAEEDRRRREEEALAAERRKREEAETKERAERAYLAGLVKSREDFHRAGRPAPDPYTVPGLVLHLGFDADRTVWPVAAGVLEIPPAAARGPGPRGTGLYLPINSRVTLKDLSPAVANGLRDSVTVSGWVKLRYRPVTMFEFQEAGGIPVGHFTAEGNRLVFNSRGPREPAGDRTTGPGTTRVAGFCQWDADWHHVAAVRERRRSDDYLSIYLDGKLVTQSAVQSADWAVVGRLAFGIGVDPGPGTWSLPAGPPDRAGRATWPGPDEPAYAIDELCVYGRALAAAEVRRLAGIDSAPADLAKKDRPADPEARLDPLTLTPAPALPRLAGIAFDRQRGAAWAVTDAPQAELLKLSYPAMNEVARYRLNGAAGPVAFDQPGNRLFVAVGPAPVGRVEGPGLRPDLVIWPSRVGGVHRYNLDALDPGVGRVIGPSAALNPRSEFPQKWPITALAVSPDGAWLAATQVSVFRVPTHFQNPDDLKTAEPVGDRAAFMYRLSPATGADVWVGVNDGLSLLDMAEGRAKNRVRFPPGTDFNNQDWAVHPAGDRAYAANVQGGVDELPLRPGGARRAVLAPLGQFGQGSAFFALTGDGRYLFTAAGRAQPPVEAHVTAVDLTADPPRTAGGLKAMGAQYLAPFWTGPDGAVLVFRTGAVLRVGYPVGGVPAPPAPVFREAAREVAPLPRPAIPHPVPFARPAPPPATEFPALRFYLPLDDAPGATVREAVSGKAVGALAGARAADGPRGKALRFGYDARFVGNPPRLDLGDQKAALRVAAGEPFTLSLWVRPMVPTGAGTVFTAFRPAAKGGLLRLDVVAGSNIEVQMAEGADKGAPEQNLWRSPPGAPGEWHHLAIVRSAGGDVRVLVDGVAAPHLRGLGRFAGELSFESILMQPRFFRDGGSADLAEFALFGAALTGEQVRKLGGLPAAP